MGVWDTYQDRIEAHGVTKRGAALLNEKQRLLNKLPDSLSYQSVTVFDSAHGYNISTEEMLAGAITKNVAIINTDNLNEKYICSLPDDDIEHGSLIYWMNNYWLVTERDANITVYTKAKMIQCNYLLKWVSDDNRIIEQWSIVEDGTKYLTGELEDRQFIVTRGDSRLALTIARNNQTVKFTRANRFLIDDTESPLKLAYALTKPFKLGWAFNDTGVYKFVLQEVNTTDDDNQELGIADFYKHFPKHTVIDSDTGSVINTDNVSDGTGKKVWL